jgi:hypothetical protein
MYPPCSVVGLSPRSGEAETPPKSRLRPSPGVGRGGDSSEVEVEAEPWGRARRRPSFEVEVEAEPWGRARRRSSSEVEVDAEPWGRARRRPSSEVEVEASPGVGRGGDRIPRSGEAESVFRARGGGRAPGSGETELPMAPDAGLGCCQPHPGEWHNSRSRAGDAVFLSGQSVEGRSDCGHFGPAD